LSPQSQSPQPPTQPPTLIISNTPTPTPTPHAQVNDEHAGAVIEALGLRRGELTEMGPAAGSGGGGVARQQMVFEVPARGMIGFRCGGEGGQDARLVALVGWVGAFCSAIVILKAAAGV